MRKVEMMEERNRDTAAVPVTGSPEGPGKENMPDAELLWRNIFAIADDMKTMHADSRRVSVFYQITLSQLKMVGTVFRLTRATGAGVALKVVAKDLGTTAAAASEMVDVLVRKNILARNQDPDDRRQVRIRLVPELQKHFCGIEAQFTELTAEYVSTLAPEQRQAVGAGIAGFLEFVRDRAREKGQKDK